MALLCQNAYQNLLKWFRSFIVHSHFEVSGVVRDAHIVIALAKNGRDIHGLILGGHGDGQLFGCPCAEGRREIFQLDIQQLEAAFGLHLQNDGLLGHILYHIGIFRVLVDTIQRY